MRPLLRLLLLPVLALAPVWAADVEIRLTSGERAFGELLTQDDELVVLNRKVWTRNGQIVGRAEFPRRRVAEITPVTSMPKLYEERSKAAPDTYEGQFTLARWCFERGLQEQAYTHAKKLYDRDTSDVVTHQLMGEIGYMRDGEQWIKAGDYATKHGLVAYEGKLQTPQQVELRKAELKADATRDALVAKQRSLDATIANSERRVADAQERVAKTAAQVQSLKADEAKAKAAQARAAEAAKTGNTKAMAASTHGMVVINDLGDQVKTAEGKQRDAQKSLANATKDLEQAKANAQANRDATAKAEEALTAAKAAVSAAMPAEPAGEAAAEPAAQP